MVATVNPSSNESLLVSLPRDTYAEIAGHDTQDKINYAYVFGGAVMSMYTVEKWLDVCSHRSLHHYQHAGHRDVSRCGWRDRG